MIERFPAPSEHLGLSPTEFENIDRVTLAVSSTGTRRYMNGLGSIEPIFISHTSGIKAPKGSNILQANGRYAPISQTDLAIDAGLLGANEVEIDCRFGSDGSELSSDVEDTINNMAFGFVIAQEEELRKLDERERHYEEGGGYIITERMERIEKLIEIQKLRNNESLFGILAPRYLSVSISSNTSSKQLAAAQKYANERGVVLVGIVGNSKKSKKEFKEDGLDPVEETIKLSRICIKGDIIDLQMAAKDAPDVLDELSKITDIDNLTISGTGAYTDGYSKSDHKRTVLVEESSGIDKYILGAPVALADVPMQSLKDHLAAMPPRRKTSSKS